MQTETQAGLETSKAFLKDSVELAHLLLKQKLEALKRGEQVEWKETRDIIREGRASARQLTQIASLEVRDSKRESRRQTHHPRPRIRDPRLTPDNLQMLMEGVIEWNEAVQAAGPGVKPPVPEKLRKVLAQFELDPDREDSIEQLLNIVEGVAG